MAQSCSLGCMRLSPTTPCSRSAPATRSARGSSSADTSTSTYANPDSPLAPGAFVYGGYNLGIVNNNNFITDKNLNVFWVGAKYAVTPTLDVMAPTTTSGTALPGASPRQRSRWPNHWHGRSAAACAANSASLANCAGGTRHDRGRDGLAVCPARRHLCRRYVLAGSGGLATGFMLSTNNGAIGQAPL